MMKTNPIRHTGMPWWEVSLIYIAMLCACMACFTVGTPVQAPICWNKRTDAQLSKARLLCQDVQHEVSSALQLAPTRTLHTLCALLDSIGTTATASSSSIAQQQPTTGESDELSPNARVQPQSDTPAQRHPLHPLSFSSRDNTTDDKIAVQLGQHQPLHQQPPQQPHPLDLPTTQHENRDSEQQLSRRNITSRNTAAYTFEPHSSMVRERRATSAPCFQTGCSLTTGSVVCLASKISQALESDATSCHDSLATIFDSIDNELFLRFDVDLTASPTQNWTTAFQMLLPLFTSITVDVQSDPPANSLKNMLHNDIDSVKAITFMLFTDADLSGFNFNHLTGLASCSFQGEQSMRNARIDLTTLRSTQLESLMYTRLVITRFPSVPSNQLLTLSLNNIVTESWLGPDVWGVATKLQNLTIVDVYLTKLQRTFLQGLSDLRHLTVSQTSVSTIEESLFTYTTLLESIDLSRNALNGSLTNVFYGLSQLRVLNLQRNQLESIDVPFARFCPRLTHLMVRRNRLSLLSDISQLEFLQVIDIERNRFDALPQFAGNTALLQVLASHNAITALADHPFRDSPNLQHLALAWNKLTALRETQSQVFPSSLRLLFLGGNQLTTLYSSWLSNLVQLRSLFLESNELTTIEPQLFANLPELLEFDARLNYLSAFPSAIWTECPRIRDVTITHNLITEVNAPAKPMSSLKIFSLRSNRLSSGTLQTADMDYLFPALTTLRLGDNQELTLDLQSFPRNMTTLTIDNIKSAKLPSEASLDFFAVGWPSLTSLQGIDVCNLISAQTAVLRITASGLTTLDIDCPLQRAIIQYNSDLTSVIFKQFVGQADLAHNKQLFSLHFETGVTILDISDTNVPLSTAFCGTLGTRIMIGNNMKHSSWKDDAAVKSIGRQCYVLGGPTWFSFHNTFTDASLSILESSFGQVAVSSEFTAREVFDTLSLKSTPVFSAYPTVGFNTECTECVANVTTNRFFQATLSPNGTDVSHIAYALQVEQSCSCLKACRQNSKGVCVKRPSQAYWSILAIFLCVLLGGIWWKSQRATMKANMRAKLKEEQADEATTALHAERDKVERFHQRFQLSPDSLTMEKQIDKGGYGEVWHGWLTSSQSATPRRLPPTSDSSSLGAWSGVSRVEKRTEVAVKTLLQSEIAPFGGAMEDFAEEMETLMTSLHKNLVGFFGIVEDFHVNGRATTGIVMEYCCNGNLMKYLYNYDQTTGISTPTVGVSSNRKLEFLEDVLSGLEYLHKCNVIHQDIKSQNVLINAELVAKISDFGTSRFTQRNMSQGQAQEEMGHNSRPYSREEGMKTRRYAASVGTPLFMSPEALRGGCQPTSATDMFSFGILLWEVVTQNAPDIFDILGLPSKGPTTSLLLTVREENRRLPDDRIEAAMADMPDAAAVLVDVYTKCCLPDPEQRPTAADALERIQKVLDMVGMQNPPLPERQQRSKEQGSTRVIAPDHLYMNVEQPCEAAQPKAPATAEAYQLQQTAATQVKPKQKPAARPPVPKRRQKPPAQVNPQVAWTSFSEPVNLETQSFAPELSGQAHA
eukprot:m.333864 g.333864  ORF g.333864 m.333864 type:complete len:1544 (-) comp16067_c0_seq7:381-5012(-)